MAFNEARFINKGKQEQPSLDEDVAKGNPIVEAVFKPRWNVPLLSKYTSFVGRAAKKVDKSIEKKEGTSKLVNLGTLLGQYSLSGINVSPGDIMSTVTPFVGDVETGKYSLFDIALGAAEIIPAAKAGKSVIKSLTKPTKKKFEKNIRKALKKGGKEQLESAKQWQKEWITDPETFVRQKQGGKIPDAPSSYTSGPEKWATPPEEIKRIKEIWDMKPRSKKEVERFVKLARKPKMSRSRMKKEGFVHEWDSYLKYKDKMTKEFDRLEFHEKLPWVKEGGEWKRLPDETMEEWRKMMKFDEEPWMLRPGEVNPSKAAEKVKYGFGLPENQYKGVYRPGYDVTDINQAIKRRVTPERMGSYHEMVEVSPAIKTYESTAIHELQHFITKGNKNIPDVVSDAIRALRHGDMDGLAKVWKQKKLAVFKDGDVSKGWRKAKGATDKEIKGTVEYFGNRTEIQARLQQMRHSLGVKPGQKVTEKMLIFATKTKRQNFYSDLVNVLGKENIIKALNTLPAIVPMVAEDELFNQWDREDNLF
jgi:hypothetical protein